MYTGVHWDRYNKEIKVLEKEMLGHSTIDRHRSIGLQACLHPLPPRPTEMAQLPPIKRSLLKHRFVTALLSGTVDLNSPLSLLRSNESLLSIIFDLVLPQWQQHVQAINLHGAASCNRIEELQMKLHMSGMDIDALSRLGSTAVQCAANCGQTEAMRFLIQCGANLDKTNQYGETALMLAADKGHIEVLRLLLQCGADPSAQSNWGDTALSKAKTSTASLDLRNAIIATLQAAGAKR